MTRTCAYCLTPASPSDPPTSSTPSTDTTSPTPTTLKLCGRCRSAHYCSTDCQRADWPTHKRVCVSADAVRAAHANDAAYRFWNHEAHKNEEARALAERLGLEMPRGRGGMKSGITYPLRRLIITGNDTAPNLHLLLGLSAAPATSITGYDSLRKHVLLDPPRGSPAEAMYRGLDDGLPEGSRDPRPADAEEEVVLQRIRDMQERAQAWLESEGRREPNTEDMTAVLQEFGEGWTEMVPVWQDAVNAMDQGVDV